MSSPWGIDQTAPAAAPKRNGAAPVSAEILRLIERRYPIWDREVIAHIYTDMAVVLTGVMAMTGIKPDKQEEFFDILKEQIKLLRQDFEEFAEEIGM